ncbi:MAG: hypothetical protein HFG67_05325 [Firmicutes bacterium]|nr:hypothetical protein [Bacillota bacterium]
MKKKILCTLAALALLLSMTVLAGCTAEKDEKLPENDEISGLAFTTETLPKIDGATALAPYYELMASKLLNADIEEARQWVLCNKTDGAYENLINGKVDMIFCSMPSEEQQAMADSAGVEFEMTPFLNGGFVFFVNKNNPIESLTVQQLHDIYSGKITNWSEVGGDDVDIIAYQRPNNSGSQTGMYHYIIAEDEIMEAPTEMKIAEMGGIIDAVASYENSEGAIGYSYYYYVTSMHYTDQIKLVQIDGIEPSDDTIADGTYPLINPSYAIINADTPEDSPVRDILKWLVSASGQNTAREAGYVPRLDGGSNAEEK